MGTRRSIILVPAQESSSGHALVSVLLMLAALTPLGAFAALQARLDVLVQRHVYRAAAVFAAAESGLEHARSEVRLAPSFERLVYGPDGQPATGDDGEFPFLGVRALPVDPGFGYELRVTPMNATTVEVIVTAKGPEQSTYELSLTVVRDRARLPAAVATTASRPTLALSPDFRLVGNDQSGRDPTLAGLAVANGDLAAQMRAGIPTVSAGQIAGAGPEPSVIGAGTPAVEELATKLAEHRTYDLTPGTALGSGIGVSAGSLDIDDGAGDGVLIVGGNLHVAGALTFSGLVIVLGDVRFDTASIVRIEGGLLQGRGNGVLALLGAGSIAYDSDAIQRVDADHPGILGHRARVVGWRDRS